MISSPIRVARMLPLALILIGFTAPTSAEAALILTVTSSQAANGVGSFDVILSSNDGSYGVGGFSVELAVAASSGVLFTGASTATTTVPYLFGTLQTPPLTFATFPTTDFIASDSDASSPGFRTLASNGSFGLEHVTYSVTPGTAAGPIPVSILGVAGGAPTTQIDDINGTPFSFIPFNGTITFATVPEPASLALSEVALSIALGAALSRRRKP